MTHLSRLQEKIKASKVDAVVYTEENNVYWTCGFRFEDGALLVTEDKAFLLTDHRFVEAITKNVDGAFEVLLPEKRMTDALAELVKKEGVQVLGLECDCLACNVYFELKNQLPGVELTDFSATTSRLRTVKDAVELEMMGKAQVITDGAFAHLLQVMTPEMTEREVALELEYTMLKNGADGLAFSTIAVSGAHSSMPHGVPCDEKLNRGFLTLDFGAKYHGYCSDMTRTVVLGKADGDMKKLYDAVLTAQKNAIDALHENMPCAEADGVARQLLEGDYPGGFSHSLGHGVGLVVHEQPSLSPRAKPISLLRRGTVFTVEPGVYLAGKYGVRIEDMLCIDLDGKVRDFTASPKELIELF